MSDARLLRAKMKDEKRDAYGEEKSGEAGVAKHDDPMQIGLILDGFTGDQMFFDVGQCRSSRVRACLPHGALTFQEGRDAPLQNWLARIIAGSDVRHHANSKKRCSTEYLAVRMFEGSLVALTGIEPVFRP